MVRTIENKLNNNPAMKRILTLIAFLPTLGFAQICNPNGNIVIFSNYDGGVLNIDVDADIPNLKIGVVSYEGVTINLSGTYVNNVVAVEYAGYNADNANCGSVINTSINGAPGGATTNILLYPPAGLSNPNGNGNIICASSCDNGSNQGGCNTVDQVEDYFITLFSGTLYSHTVQYGCWSGNHLVSAAGTCCPAAAFSSSYTSANNSCNAACDGTATVTATGGTTPYSYSWSPGGMTTATVTGLCANTYTVTVTDSGGGSEMHTVVITEPSAITSTQDVDVCEGDDYTYPDGSTVTNLTVNESHVSSLTAGNGCDSTVTTNINVITLPNNGVSIAGNVLTADQAGATYQWVDCNNGNADVTGETGQSFIPTANGSYAVEVTVNGCTVTSTCSDITGVGFIENTFGTELSIFPNPTDGNLKIDLGAVYSDVEFIITDLAGKIVLSHVVNESQIIELELDQPAGTYLMTIKSETQKAVFRLVKI